MSWRCIALFPVSVLVAVEAAFFSPIGGRTVVAEQGRYIFPAITALAAIAVGGTFGLGRRWQIPLATVLVVGMMALCYASQLLDAWELLHLDARRVGASGASIDFGPAAGGS